MIEVKLASKLDDSARMQISEIFTDGFFQWLKYFSKDKGKLANAFAHIFNLDVFYVAIEDDEITGMTACTNNRVPSVKLQKKELVKYLGFFMGNIAYMALRKEFEEKQYPFTVAENLGLIEFVAVSSKHRHKGVATILISHIMQTTAFLEYALEVADTNTNAVSLYEKLGFSEFLRVKQEHSKQSGINYLLYMKTTK